VPLKVTANPLKKKRLRAHQPGEPGIHQIILMNRRLSADAALVAFTTGSVLFRSSSSTIG